VKLALSGNIGGTHTQVLIEDGLIAKIGQLSNGDFGGVTCIETSGNLHPGFIDVHVHGGGGAEVMDATEEAFEQMAFTHAKHGTTGLLLTTVTHSIGQIESVLTAYRGERDLNGAEILGFHIEGPFISCHKPGAQAKEYIIPPNAELFNRWYELSRGTIRYLTVAPEEDGAKQLIQAARQHSVVVAMGHSHATSAQALQGIEWGAQSVTHLFNAMTSALHREPGLAGTALGDERLMVELIADLIHVHPLMLKTALRAKGLDKVMLITDAIRAATMEEGEYTVGNRTIYVKNGAVRLENGTLAGSMLTLDRAVQNLLRIGAITPADVSQVTAVNPSRLLGLPHGSLEVGAPGSLIAVDSDWNVTHTVVRGKLVYQK
jgi:N-acetylglucosamine-6-phosphate deacetylase